MPIELFNLIYDFLQTLTPEGFENTNKLVTYVFVIFLFVMFIKLLFSIFKPRSR